MLIILEVALIFNFLKHKQIQQRETVVRPTGARSRMRRRNTSAASTSSAPPQAEEGLRFNHFNNN